MKLVTELLFKVKHKRNLSGFCIVAWVEQKLDGSVLR